ncbi:MAG: dihydrolipoyl dehydrogenase [Erythrobacter sp.]|nr:dihydrolipoyl dehydrogenase [Erythrobacter sp.]MBA4051449.1 dihydrolipoyl dehydrogenase [Erythrobacter sp.]MBA4163792.1 dihydrolipoyl dehydrogenase [Erythrobacter sp.]
MQGSSSLTADVVIIGTGSAGMSAYKAARRFTDSILVIEEGAYGTTCARVGCMPSKLLIAAAEAAHHSANAARFGIETGPITVDGKAVMDRVRSERDRFVGFVEEDVESWPDAHKVIGSARFVGPNDLELDDGTRICGDRIIIATGSRPVWPAHWNDLGDRLIINDDVFSWTDLPRAVAVFGNGVIGLELAQALHRLGVRIKLYGLGGLVGPLTDPEIVNAARSAFASEFRFAPEADVISIKREASSVIVTERIDGGVIKERFDYLLAATGRRPNLDRLNLEKAGILLDARGTPMDWDRHTTRIGHSRIFLAGDAAPDAPLLHEASDAGRIAGENAARFPFVAPRHRRTPLGVVFSDPQIAMVGKTYKELVQSGMPFATGSVDFTGQGRARVGLRNVGKLNVYAHPVSGRFLGAEMVGPAAEHVAHLLAWAIEAERTVQQMLDSPFYHPVIEEGVRTALRAVRNAMEDSSPAHEPCLDCRTAA